MDIDQFHRAFEAGVAEGRAQAEHEAARVIAIILDELDVPEVILPRRRLVADWPDLIVDETLDGSRRFRVRPTLHTHEAQRPAPTNAAPAADSGSAGAIPGGVPGGAPGDAPGETFADALRPVFPGSLGYVVGGPDDPSAKAGER